MTFTIRRSEKCRFSSDQFMIGRGFVDQTRAIAKPVCMSAQTWRPVMAA